MKIDEKLTQISLIILLIPLIYAGLTQVYAADIFWHLKMGTDFLFKGLSPFSDHYSIEFLNKPLIFVAWFFQILAGFFNWVFGEYLGIRLLRIFLWLIPIGLLSAWLKNRKTPLSVYLFCVAGLMAVLVFRRLLRPELCSYGLLLFYILVYLEKRKKISLKLLIFMIPLQILWNNIHIVSIMGYVILGALYLEYLMMSLKDRSLSLSLKLLGLGLITLAIDFINPWLTSGLLQVLKRNDYSVLEEFSGLVLSDLSIFMQSLILIAPFLIFYLGRQGKWGAILILGVFLFQTWAMAKIVVFFSIVTLAFLVEPLELVFSKIRQQHLKFFLAVAICSLPIYQLITQSFLIQRKPSNQLNPIDFPVELESYLGGSWAKGKILNDFDIGGYLIYKYGPDLKVTIDGRTHILYPHQYFMDYLERFYKLEEFKKFDDRIRFDWVIDKLERANTLMDNSIESQRFSLEYVTDSFILLKRSIQDRDLRATLLFRFPQCLKKTDLDILSQFAASKPHLMAPPSPFYRFLNFLNQFWGSDEPKTFLENLVKIDRIDDLILRTSAYQALALNEPRLALGFWNRVRNPLPRRDLFKIVDILCETDSCRNSIPYLKANTKEFLPDWARRRLKQQYNLIESKNSNIELLPPDTLALFKQRTFITKKAMENIEEPDPCVSHQ